jgi:hypothetical protein
MRTPAFSRYPSPPRRDDPRLPGDRRSQSLPRDGARAPGLIGAVTAGALAGMMLAPANGSVLVSPDAPVGAFEGVRTTPKAGRLPKAGVASPMRPASSACTPLPAAPVHSGPIAYV